MGLRAGLDTKARGKILCLCRGLNPDRPVVQSVVRHYTDRATPAPIHIREYYILYCTEIIKLFTKNYDSKCYGF
jgi:hypothetical protein